LPHQKSTPNFIAASYKKVLQIIFIIEQSPLYWKNNAVYEAMRRYKTTKEGILVAWGILEEGRKILLGMKLGNKESYQDWLDFFRDLKRRGLPDPVLGTSNGAPGLIRALEECFPKTLRQRCLVHKKMNILGKVPSEAILRLKLI